MTYNVFGRTLNLAQSNPKQHVSRLVLSALQYCDLSVCLSVCPLHISQTKRPNFTKLSVHVICGCG